MEKNIEKFISLTKERPGLCLGGRTQLDILYTVLYAISFYKCEDSREELMKEKFWDNFHNFVVKYFQMENRRYVQQGKNWCEEIESHCSSKDESYYLFFDIFDEFMKDFNKKY